MIRMLRGRFSICQLRLEGKSSWVFPTAMANIHTMTVLARLSRYRGHKITAQAHLIILRGLRSSTPFTVHSRFLARKVLVGLLVLIVQVG